MVERRDSNVKGAQDWIDGHPRTGWYVAILSTANFFLLLVDTLIDKL